MRPVIKQCSRCRKTKEIVFSIKGMGYCEGCKDKAPTKQQFEDYVNEKIHRACRPEPRKENKFIKNYMRDS